MPITKTRIKKIENLWREQVEKEKEKDYQWLFKSREEFEEAKKAGRVKENMGKDEVALIVDL